MSSKSNIFPAIIRVEFDGSESAFAEFDRAAQQSTDRARRQFETFYGDVKRLAEDALGRNKNAFGALDLNVKGANAAADAAARNAVALREIANAADRASKANSDNSEATRQYVQAARAAAIEAERQSRSRAQEALDLDRLQQELNQTASATQSLASAQRGVGTSLSGNRTAYVQTGAQLQDIAIQMVGGQRASLALAQQLPQLAFALSGVGGRVGAVATALSGPWSLALVGGSFLLGSFIDRLFGASGASDKLGKSTESLADALDFQRKGIAAVLQATRDLTAEREKARQVDIIEAENDVAIAKGKIRKALAIREELAARLALEAQANRVTAGSEDKFSRLAIASVVGRPQIELRENAALINGLRDVLRQTQIDLGKIESGINTDPVKAINAQYDRMAFAAQEAAAGNDSLAASITKTLTVIEKQRQAALEAQREREKTSRSSGTGVVSDVPTVAQLSRILREEFPGTRITDGLRSKNAKYGAKNSYHKIGQAVDFVPAGGMGSISKAQIRAALESRGVTIAELLGPGDKGHSDHFHVAVTKGKVALQGFIDAERDAAKAAEELNRSLNQIAAELDPTVRAALEYAAVLEKIATLESAGRISGIDATGFRIAAVKAENDRARAQLARKSDDMFKDAGIDPKEDLKAIVDGIVEANDQASQRAAEQFEREMGSAIDALANLLGVRFGRAIDEAARASGPGSGLGDFLSGIGKGREEFKAKFRKILEDGFSKLFKNTKIAEKIGAGLEGARMGEATSDVARALGIKQSRLGSQIGGAIGGAIAGPIGSIVGGFLGGTLGGALKRAKTGSSSISVGADGRIAISSTTGSSAKFRKASGESADSAISTIDRIAEALGGSLVAGAGAVSIGIRGGKYRVDTTGKGITKTKKGAIDFGEDAEAAIKFATLDLIKDGVIAGLRASTQRLLQNAKDLDTAIDKAVRFEGVFQRLKAIKDPVGAALDALNKEFTSLKKLFEDAGASAEEFRQLEELYGLERAKAIKETSEQLTSSLRSLIDDLKIGDNGLSLRDRLTNARAAFDPLAAQVRAGQTVDYEAFAQAARNVLDIQRLI